MGVYRLDIAYDGSGFRGYARQVGIRTVQGELESAIETLLKEEFSTAVAGRTDAGVHALGQVVSLNTEANLDTGKLLKNLNGILGPEIAVSRVEPASEEFSARFSATWRRYRYLMSTAPVADPLVRRHVWQVGRSLDTAVMSSAARAFIGEHDFSSFCKSVEGRSNVRHVTSLDLESEDDLHTWWIEANAFCHQMVRSVVGHLYDIGRGFSDAAEVESVIASRDRSRVATVAPPHGLTLMAVGYD